jgi:nucleoside-diphosphate-sugar epimerase
MPTCLLTGATGFLGAHLARTFLAEGWTVRALARGPKERQAELVRGGLSVVSGDLSDRTDFAAAARGVDAIVHAAGVTKARTLDEYREANSRGTERLVRGARQSAPGALFVLVSSQAAAGPARDGRPVSEGDAPRPVSWYGLSKLEGEESVRRDWPGAWIVVRPSVIYGPGDRALLTLFRAAARGFLPVPSGASRIQVIGVERAADAIARAAKRPDLSGRRGFLCDPRPVSIRELAQAIAELFDRRPRLVPVARPLVLLAGRAETVLEALTRRSRAFNADKAREILAGDWICDGAPFARDLGLPEPSSLEDGLSATWRWYRQNHWLPL